MASRRSDIWVIWPEYFDSALTRAQGRRVTKENSVVDPTCEKIFKISRKMGLSPEIEVDKSHPSTWYKSRGRVIVKKKGKKTELLNAIGAGLGKMK